MCNKYENFSEKLTCWLWIYYWNSETNVCIYVYVCPFIPQSAVIYFVVLIFCQFNAQL